MSDEIRVPIYEASSLEVSLSADSCDVAPTNYKIYKRAYRRIKVKVFTVSPRDKSNMYIFPAIEDDLHYNRLDCKELEIISISGVILGSKEINFYRIIEYTGYFLEKDKNENQNKGGK